MKLEDEIKQTAFKNDHQKAAINVIFTASWLNQMHMETLKPFNISIQQFNILRILRGMKSNPASVKLLGERMVDKMSNASRLVEKLKAKGLVERNACPHDRRQVDICITKKGLQVTEKASQELELKQSETMKTISPEEATLLSEILDKLRG